MPCCGDPYPAPTPTWSRVPRAVRCARASSRRSWLKPASRASTSPASAASTTRARTRSWRSCCASASACCSSPGSRPDWTPVAPPLFQSSTFTNPIGSTSEVLYSRYGNNPNQTAIGKRLALLEGAEAAIFVASGMGATALAHLAVLRPGDHLLSSEWIYGGVHRLFAQEFGRLGIDVTFVNPVHSRSWKQAMKQTTRATFVEP